MLSTGMYNGQNPVCESGAALESNTCKILRSAEFLIGFVPFALAGPCELPQQRIQKPSAGLSSMERRTGARGRCKQTSKSWFSSNPNTSILSNLSRVTPRAFYPESDVGEEARVVPNITDLQDLAGSSHIDGGAGLPGQHNRLARHIIRAIAALRLSV